MAALAAWVLGVSSEASADTLKGKAVSTISKVERFPVWDADNHNLGYTLREGVIVFENGEVATTKATAVWDMVGPASGWAKGYVQYYFLDGSTMVLNFHQQFAQPAEGASVQYDSTITGDIIKGTGKYEGVKGNFTSSSRQMKSEKGEPTGRLVSDFILNYSK
jgi:hypothetical protein